MWHCAVLCYGWTPIHWQLVDRTESRTVYPAVGRVSRTSAGAHVHHRPLVMEITFSQSIGMWSVHGCGLRRLWRECESWQYLLLGSVRMSTFTLPVFCCRIEMLLPLPGSEWSKQAIEFGATISSSGRCKRPLNREHSHPLTHTKLTQFPLVQQRPQQVQEHQGPTTTRRIMVAWRVAFHYFFFT